MNEVVDTAATIDKPTSTKQARHGKQPKPTKEEKAGSGKRPPIQACKQKCAYMYVGPNAPMEGLFSGNTYKDCLPEYYKEKFAKLPELEKLFIDVYSLPAVKLELAEQGTKMHSLYQYVETQIQEGVLKNGV